MNRKPALTPIEISDELAQKCDADNQFERFDRVFRQVVATPKKTIDKEAARLKRRKARAKKS